MYSWIKDLQALIDVLKEKNYRNLGGPAKILSDGTEIYGVDGPIISKEEWEVHPKVVAHRNEKKLKGILKIE